MDWKDLNTYGSLASLIGIAISFLAYIAATKAKRAAQKIQDSFIFDKRIPQHLKELDIMLRNFNELLKDIEDNESEIKALLTQMKSEISSLLNKMETKKIINEIKSTINLIEVKVKNDFLKEKDSEKPYLKIFNFFKRINVTSHKTLWKIYTDLNEIFHDVKNLNLDRKYLIK